MEKERAEKAAKIKEQEEIDRLAALQKANEEEAERLAAEEKATAELAEKTTAE